MEGREHIPHEQEVNVLEVETDPKIRIERQFALARELYESEVTHQSIDFSDTKINNEMMFKWVKDGCAKAYADIEQHEDFKYHRRLNGSSGKIMLDDVAYFIQHGTLPE